MDDSLRKNLIQIALTLFTIAIVFAACKFRKLPVRETLGLIVPDSRTFLFWIGLYLPIFFIMEAGYFGLGLAKGNVWVYQGFITGIRILKIGLLGPIAEELVFRGLLFDRISRAKPGPIAAVILTAIFFAAAHFSYDIMDILMILVDGLYFGWVRHKTGSVLIPIVLHIFINIAAIVEFLFINSRF
ncbi:MAG: CPBP family intramembrane metalloprotease [bacterium]|nr:CPBP family intramembrane metalloprotease [bacterium]